jgi:[acyl-carrier-protein] S-malonyltransferase
MGRSAYDQSEAARALYAEADNLLGKKLSDLIFEGPEEKLTETAYQQPALFVASMANWAFMNGGEWPEADFVAGHSLGEFSALAAAGSISFADGLRLVQRRGELMREAGEVAPGAMAAILALPREDIERLCRRVITETGRLVAVANDNCPGQLVISGDESALQRAMDLAQEAGARKVVRLPITIAAHTALMGSVAEEFAQAVDNTPIKPPRLPVIGNVSALPLLTAQAIRDELKAQLISPVAWTASIQYLADQGVDTFVEVGPNNVLLGLVKRIDRRAVRTAFDNGPDN